VTKTTKPQYLHPKRRSASLLFAVGVAAAILGGCTSTPKDYAATLSAQDPKWSSPECVQIRAQALEYKERSVNWASGALIGPYGLAIVAAGKEHQEKQRKLFARDMHLRCSSKPLPKNLEIQAPVKKGNSLK
jgi:hypothetical protein